jgi:iron complex outermembrane recepter protein
MRESVLSGPLAPASLAATTCAVLLCSPPLFAEAGDSNHATSAAETAAAEPEEVLVTARRKNENAQTVPVSVSVLDAKTLAEQGIETTNDLQRLVPGVILNGAGSISNTTYTIRGQGKAVTGQGLPSVITYVNEVPLPSLGSYAPTFDVDNVQVLKGPQGTLFGRNTTGGALLVYSTPATYNFNGYVQADFGDYNKHYFQGAINIPLVSDKLAIRIAGDIERRQGYAQNITTGQDQDNVDTSAVRVTILAQPTDRIKNVTVLDYTQFVTHASAYFPFQVADPAATPALAAAVADIYALGKRTVATVGPWPQDNDAYWGAANTTTIDLGVAKFKNIFGYRNTRIHYAQNSDGLATAPLPELGPQLDAIGFVAGQPGVLLKTVENLTHMEQFSDEIQFSGDALDKSLSWLVGAFYLDGRPDGANDFALDIFRPTPASATTTFVANNFLNGASPAGSLADTFYSDSSRAVFGNVSYDLGKLSTVAEGLKLNAGYRYTTDRESLCSNGRSAISLATGTLLVPAYGSLDECRAAGASAYGPASFSGSAKFNASTYTAGLDYELNEAAFLYFTTRRGYRAGGLNTPAMAPSLADFQTFKPQTLTDYEIGAHTKWNLDGWRGRFNIAAFTGKFSQLQQQVTGIVAGGPNVPADVNASNAPTNTALEINAGTATVQGIEFDGSVSPFKALNISYGGSYLNEHYDTLSPPGVLAPLFASSNFTGAPRWSFQGAVQYYLPVNSAIGAVSLNANYYYLGKEYQGSVLLPQYSLTSLGVDWNAVNGGPLSVRFYVDNVFDKLYVQNVLLSNASFGVFTGNYGPPRMYGVRLRYDF